MSPDTAIAHKQKYYNTNKTHPMSNECFISPVILIKVVVFLSITQKLHVISFSSLWIYVCALIKACTF